jgi:hypothetical protein
MSKDLFGKTLAECQGYHFSAVKQNTNKNGEHNKYITLNSQPGNRETAVNIYLSKNLASKVNLGEYVNPQSLIREMVNEDEETGEVTSWPLLTSNSTYVTLDELLAMFS